MNKQNFLTRMLLLFALIVGSVNGAWAETVTFTAGTDKSEGTSITKNGITISFSSGVFNRDDNFRCYSGASMTISSSSGSITKIDFTATSGNPMTKFSGNPNVGSWTDSNKTQWTGNATEINFGTTSGQCRITEIIVTYEKASLYDITAVSNNDLWGSVTGTTTITAEPADGYRVKAGVAGYTVTSGTATVTNNGNNTFSVSASSNCTVQINFEEIPSFNLSSIISPAAVGTVSLSATTIKEGATATATAEANAGYKFTGWSITGSGASLSSTSDNPTTVTMGTEDATLTANFVAVTTYPVHWSVNGNIIKTDNVEENTAITFDEPAIGVPTGYSFCGWVEEANRISGTTNTDPKSNYVKSANATAEITYYAVMAKETITPEYFIKYEKVTSAQTDWSGTYLLGATYTGGTKEENKGTWIYASPSGSGKYGEKAAIGELTNEQEDNEIVIAKSANGYTIYHKNSSNYFGYGGSNNELNFYDAVSDKKQEWTITEVAVIKNVEYSSRVLQYNGSSPRFACYTTDQTATDLYKRIQGGGATYSGYCTTIPDESVTVTSAGLATYVSDFDLDYSDKSISAYIAKEDDGKIKMTQVYKVPAGTGVLLKANGAAKVNIPITTEITTDDTDNVKDNLFKRGEGKTVSSVTAPSFNYILNNIDDKIGFYRANNKIVARNRAYLQTTIDAPANGRLSIFFDDEAGEATGISEVKDVKAADAIFNLNGVRVKNMTKGLYIVNGKKVIVK